MEAPAVHYATTSDGMRIAYGVIGAGDPLVYMPWATSYFAEEWRMFLDEKNPAFGNSPLSMIPRSARSFASRFRVVQYDARGQGLSSRGLPESHCIKDYVLDLEAIIGELGLRDFVLYSGVLSGHVAIHYAIAHPELVRALVLDSGGIDRAMQNAHLFSDALETSWDAFLQMHASMFEGGAAEARLTWLRSATTHADYIKTLKASNESNVESVLAAVSTPSLVVAAPTFPATVDAAQRLAAGIPGAQLHLFGGHLNEHLDAAGSDPSPALVILSNFLKNLSGQAPESLGASHSKDDRARTLSRREIEVLCLIATGQSNAQIAEVLVISPNTVGHHVSNIFDKLALANRAEATAYALRNGFVA